MNSLNCGMSKTAYAAPVSGYEGEVSVRWRIWLSVSAHQQQKEYKDNERDDGGGLHKSRVSRRKTARDVRLPPYRKTNTHSYARPACLWYVKNCHTYLFQRSVHAWHITMPSVEKKLHCESERYFLTRHAIGQLQKWNNAVEYFEGNLRPPDNLTR